MSRHKQEQCPQLQHLAFAEILLSHHNRETGEARLMCPMMVPAKTYKPLSALHSWKFYFKEVSGYPYGDFITEAFNPISDHTASVRNCHLAKVATEVSTYSLTIVAGLEAAIPDLANQEKSTIHVIGATNEEVFIVGMTEDLLHLLPNLKTIIVGYIGPGTPTLDSKAPQLLGMECCPKCQEMHKLRRISVERRLYHNFRDQSPFSAHHARFHSGIPFRICGYGKL